MRTLRVHNLPEDVHEALRQRAAERRTSMASEAVRLLKHALRTDRVGMRALLDEIERKRVPAKASKVSAATMLRELRGTR